MADAPGRSTTSAADDCAVRCTLNVCQRPQWPLIDRFRRSAFQSNRPSIEPTQSSCPSFSISISLSLSLSLSLVSPKANGEIIDAPAPAAPPPAQSEIAPSRPIEHDASRCRRRLAPESDATVARLHDSVARGPRPPASPVVVSLFVVSLSVVCRHRNTKRTTRIRLDENLDALAKESGEIPQSGSQATSFLQELHCLLAR